MAKFIKFGVSSDDWAVTLYPVRRIEAISLFDVPDEEKYSAFKIIMWLKGEDKGYSEYFCYDSPISCLWARIRARWRFRQLLAILNT